MVNTSHANQEFTYMLLIALRRVSAAILATFSLAVTTWAYGVPLNEPYQALLIVAALLALILFPGGGQKPDVVPSHISSLSLSIVSRWCLLVAVLLLLGYATKTSSIFSRRALLTWFVVTPPLLVVAQFVIKILLTRVLQSAGNMRRVIVAGASDIGRTLARKIQSSPFLGMQFEGFFDDRGEDRLSGGSSVPLLGKLKELPTYVR
jgi:putative colanic acid biosynthesis UDP-glucose lipid carrier transferase